MKITAVIPTVGRPEILNSVIFSIFQQNFVDEFILLDESDIPTYRQYQVEQAIDLLSRKGVKIKIIRERNKKGIGSARVRLVEESSNDFVLMVDDDVVLGKDCVSFLAYGMDISNTWSVPSCILVSKVYPDGYIDKVVKREDPIVEQWVNKYPWYLPWFEYDRHFVEKLSVAGTQAILLNKSVFLDKARDIEKFGNLPREDTYMTVKMGQGVFVSSAKCYHFVCPSQQERMWDNNMYYRIHTKIIENPDRFKDFIL